MVNIPKEVERCTDTGGTSHAVQIETQDTMNINETTQYFRNYDSIWV